MPRMDEKKFHTPEFQRKGSSGNIWCKLLQKRITRKTAECSKHLRHIAIEKYILSDLNRCIFQISLKYIKLVILKILFILVLCSFSFYFKITWPPQQSYPPPPAKTFLKFLTPHPPHPKLEGGSACPEIFTCNLLVQISYWQAFLWMQFWS